MTEAARGNAGGVVAVFVLQRLPAIIARYGRNTGRELLHNLIRDRIHPLAPDAEAFAWSGDTVLLVAPAATSLANLEEQIRSRAELPFEHRFVSGAVSRL